MTVIYYHPCSIALLGNYTSQTLQIRNKDFIPHENYKPIGFEFLINSSPRTVMPSIMGRINVLPMSLYQLV